MRQRVRVALSGDAWRLGVLAAALVCAGAHLKAQTTREGAASQPSKMPVFKSDVREVSIVFRVIDKDNQPVGVLTPADIQIEDQGISRKITSFHANIAHAQVVILADVSGSMSTVLEPLQGALYTFADIVSKDFDREPADILLSLVPFGNTATMLIHRTSHPMEFKQAVRRLRPSGSTALVDSVIAALLNEFGRKDITTPPKPVAADQGDSPIPSRYARRRPSARSPGTDRFGLLIIFTDAGANGSAHKWSDFALPRLASALGLSS